MVNTWTGNFLEEKPVRYFEQHHPYIPKKSKIIVKSTSNLSFFTQTKEQIPLFFSTLITTTDNL